MTLTELFQYTGASDSTAYIAVSGVIYDVTTESSNGYHQGYQLGGTDATAVFAASPHATSWLNQLTKVASLEGAPLIPTSTTNPTNPTDDGDDDDYDEEHVAFSNLPQAIKDYISANYPTAIIDEIEKEDGFYEIEFENDLELYFTLTGSFVRTEVDDYASLTKYS